MKRALITALAVSGLALSATAASAYTMDSDGTGFVGKGEVQTALSLNNAGLQNGKFTFSLVETTVTERSWICTNSNNENEQQRERTTTTERSGLLSSVARERNQITGFNLTGFDGTPTVSSTSEGNSLNSCPSGPWVLTTPAGEPELVSSTGGLFVNGVLLP